MIKYILRQWKYKKMTVFLIITGFFIGSLILSAGTSFTVENIKIIDDQYSGDPKKQLLITVKGISLEDAAEYFKKCSAYGETQMLSLDNADFGNKKKAYQVVPVLFHEENDWHVPLLKGRYFNMADQEQSDKKAIIGKGIAKENNVTVKDKILVNGKEFEVIGIAGRDIRDTQWDNVIYTTWNSIIKEKESYIENKSYQMFVLKNGRDKFIQDSDKIIKDAASQGVQLSYETLEDDTDKSSINNSITITAISAILVFAIAIINVVNLMIYWILERRKGFAIMKALGAADDYIIKYIVLENIMISVISAMLALAVQSIIAFAFEDIMIKNEIYLSTSFINLFVSILVTTLCGMLASIIPAYQSIKIQPIDAINRE